MAGSTQAQLNGKLTTISGSQVFLGSLPTVVLKCGFSCNHGYKRDSKETESKLIKLYKSILKYS